MKEIIKLSEFECQIIDKKTNNRIIIDDLTFGFIAERMNWKEAKERNLTSFYRVKTLLRQGGGKDIYDGWWFLVAEIPRGETIIETLKKITPTSSEVDISTLKEISKEEFEEGMELKRKQCKGYQLNHYYDRERI